MGIFEVSKGIKIGHLQAFHHHLRVSRTAHYSTYGILSKSTRHIWIVAHGYGQMASKMISRFDHLDGETHFVIAVEGLNRFYWHETNKPAACWMTSADRYDEIEDFVGYLDAVYSRYCRHVSEALVRIHLFGFSQGCATLWRWLHASRPLFHTMTNWAGWIPEDLSYLHLNSYFNDKAFFLHYGDVDHFITPQAVSEINRVIESNGLSIKISTFEGGHVIPKQELERYLRSHILPQNQ